MVTTMLASRDKELERWRQLWRGDDIPFHRPDVHPDLVEFGDAILEGGPHRILVPLCGKSVDMAYLTERGHEVIGVEVVERAVTEFFEERGLRPEVEAVDRLTMYRAGSLTVVRGDIFEIDRSHVGQVDRIWDRAALVALPAHMRGDYTRHLRQLAAPGWAMLLSSIEYDTTVMSGPPWSVPEEEIRLHYPGASFERLARRDALDRAPHMRERGHTWLTESTYLITDGSAPSP